MELFTGHIAGNTVLSVVRWCLAGLLACLTLPALALVPLTDASMSHVAGRDGITMKVNYAKTGLQSDYVQLNNDNNDLALNLAKFSMKSVKVDGSDPGTKPLGMLNIFDAYTAKDGSPSASMQLSWDRMRMKISAFCAGKSNGDCSGQTSAGTLVYDSKGHINIYGHGGLFNLDNENATIEYGLSNANMFYRQNALGASGKDGNGNWLPEVDFRNFNIILDMPKGAGGISKDDGIVLHSNDTKNGSGDYVYDPVHLDASFDLGFDAQPDKPFQLTDTDKFALHFGYVGDLRRFKMTLNGGGLWDNTSLVGSGNNAEFDMNGTNTDLNAGIHQSMHFDFTNEFKLTIADADNGTGEGAGISFKNWTKLTKPAVASSLSDYGINIPLMAIGMVDSNHYPGGICFGANWAGPASACYAHAETPGSGKDYAYGGANYIDLKPREQGLGIAIRNESFRAYPQTVEVYDPYMNGVAGVSACASNPASCTKEYDWTLITSIGDMDGNIFLYPGGNKFDFDLPIGGKAAGHNDPVTTSGGSDIVGLHGDLILANQTFDSSGFHGDNWSNGTHIMIGETGTAQNGGGGMAIGFMNMNVLFAAKDVYLDLVPESPGATEKSGYGRVNFNSQLVRLHENMIFGGGTLPDMKNMEKIAIYDINLESDGVSLSLHPHALCAAATDPGCNASRSNGMSNNGEYATAQDLDGFIHVTNTNVSDFSGNISDKTTGDYRPLKNKGTDFGSYISMAEPSDPTVDTRIANISGMMELHMTLDLQDEGQGVIGPWNQDSKGNGDYFINNTGKPRLIIDNNIRIGQAVTMPAGVQADVVRAGRVMFSGQNLGSMVIPGATIHSITTLTPQTW